MNNDQTREAWLRRASFAMQCWLTEASDGAVQPEVYVSIGFTGHPSCKLDKVLGACWTAEYQADGRPHIFISPVVAGEPWELKGVLHVLLHELCHAATRTNNHGPEFAALAAAVGLLPPWRTTPKTTTELATKFMALADRLGPWPHVPLRVVARPATLVASNNLGREARLVIPSQTKRGLPLPEHFIADILLQVAELFGGYTAWSASGGYIMVDGSLAAERVCVVDIAMHGSKTTRQQLEGLAFSIKVMGEQESVYLRLPGGRVEMV